MDLIPKLSDSKACAFLTTSVCAIRQNKGYCDEIRPESIFPLLRVMEACLETNIQGNECSQDMPFQLLHCSLQGRKFVLNVLVFVCPHFMWPWPSPFQQTLGFSLSQSSLWQTWTNKRREILLFFFFCPETYKIFPGFIYLSHAPGRSFHGRQ